MERLWTCHKADEVTDELAVRRNEMPFSRAKRFQKTHRRGPRVLQFRRLQILVVVMSSGGRW